MIALNLIGWSDYNLLYFAANKVSNNLTRNSDSERERTTTKQRSISPRLIISTHVQSRTWPISISPPGVDLYPKVLARTTHGLHKVHCVKKKHMDLSRFFKKAEINNEIDNAIKRKILNSSCVCADILINFIKNIKRVSSHG